MAFAKSLPSAVASIYEVTVDEIAADTIDYLDVALTIKDGIPEHRLFKNPTGQKRPLSSTSGHPPRVHESWPLGELNGLV